MSPTIVATLFALAGLAVVVAVIRAMAMARRADEVAERFWRELARLESDSGVAFFPTAEARLELEMEIEELLKLEGRPAPEHRSQIAALA